MALLKGRDYETNVRNMGFERATHHAIRTILEDQKALEQSLIQMAQMLDQMTTTFQAMIGMGEQLKSAHEQITKMMKPEEGPGDGL